jgi:hypothetical protein
VFSCGALEKVLGCRNGKDDELASTFESTISPRRSVTDGISPTGSPRT